MNLVQLQDDLRMLPMPVLQSKAQGQDPSVPPWLATAVLNERMNAQQKAGMAQGAAQGQQPSVAEQLEQKAGLMALQAQQQQQAQQQMMQQMAQAPQPAPEQVPQPQAQPEPEQMMARGGLARLPINPRMFNYKEGGVIGFAGGGDANTALREFLRSIGTSASEFANADSSTRAKILEAFKSATMGPQAGPAVAPSAIPATTGGSYAAQPAPRGLQALRAMLKPGPAGALGAGAALSYGATKALENMSPEQRAMLENAGGGDDTAMAAAIMNAAQPAPQAAPQAQEQATGSVFTPGSQSGLRPAQSADGIASLQKTPRPVPRPVPAQAQQAATPPVQTPPPAGLPAALPPPDAVAEMAKIKAANPVRTAPTLEDFAKQRDEAYARAGIPKDIGSELQEGIGRYEAESERIRQARQKADDLYVLSAQGGLGEIASRSAAREAANILADTIRNDKANEMRMAMAAARRAEAMGDVNALRKAQEDYNKAQDEHSKAAMTATATLQGQMGSTAATVRGQDVQAQVERERIASTAEINRLDREMRERHYRNPISAPTEKEKWVQAYRRAGLSETEAIEKVLEILGEGKAKIAAGRIDAANAKILAEDMGYVNAHKIILDPNSSADAKAKAKLTIAAKEAALNIAPEVAAPTITPAQKAALEKYGVK